MKRVVLVVLSVILFLVAAPVLIGGLIFTVMGAGDDPTLDGRLARSGSSGYAVVSDTLDVHWNYPFAERFDLRLGVRSENPATDVFIGYGPAASVDSYLSGVPHTLVYEIGRGPRADGRVEVPGSAAPQPPTAQGFWLAQASGPDLQTIPFTSGAGSYRLVVMNADGSRGVDVVFYGSVTLPYLLPVGIGLLLVGSVLLVGAIALLVWGIRSRPEPSPAAAASGPAGYPVPPAPYQGSAPPSGYGPYPPPGSSPHPGGYPGGVPNAPGQPAGPPAPWPTQGTPGQAETGPWPPTPPGSQAQPGDKDTPSA